MADHIPNASIPAVKSLAGPASQHDTFSLQHAIQGQEWCRGAVNYDEDLHFSTYYLRASLARETGRLYPGYTTVVAFYEGFTEHYYLLKRECLGTAKAIVDNALNRPDWLARVVRTIKELSDQLTRVFNPRTSPDRLARLSDLELVSLYRRHDTRQRALYRFARLPEALDRGVSYFSTYLLNHLRQSGLSQAEADETFSILSQPVVPSVLAQEQINFAAIAATARGVRNRAAPQTINSARVRMFLDPRIVERLRAHQEKWQFLSYHGYGRRELTTLGQFVERLDERLRQPADAYETNGERQYADAARTRHETLSKLDLDFAHRALFEIYPEIGAAKLYRRYAQLRNFYYFDMLVAEIARRIGVNEWTVRCMVPEEVICSLESRGPVDSAILDRSDGCLYALLGNEEVIVTGSRFRELHRLLQAQFHAVPQSGVLQGQVACRGKVTGRCRVVIRADDLRTDFEPGTILVSEATDPDLIGLLKKAGGVLTEQGGVTSHAAIICRELGIPTIIGIEGLLNRLRDGDLVEVDADRGFVTPLKRVADPSDDIVVDSSAAHSPDAVGGKAYNLGRARSFGFAVPPFVLLNFEAVRQAFERTQGHNGTHLAEWTFEQLGLAADGKLAFRSSAVGEDGENGSLAGEYESLLNVDRQHFFSALCEFLVRNRQGKREAAYRGSIIVQRMIAPACAGVCLTLDPRIGNRNAVIVEFVPGGNEAVTGGHVRPDRLVVDRLTGDILEDERGHSQLLRLEFDVAGLVPQFLTLEARFGRPLDIEWALDDRKLYILQVRPIAHLSVDLVLPHRETPDDSGRTTAWKA